MGWAFKVTHQVQTANNVTTNVAWTIPTGLAPGEIYFDYLVIAEGRAKITFYEDVVITVNTGAPTVPICMNRQSPRVSCISAAYANATINTVNATQLDVEVIGNAGQEGGRASPMFYWILARGKSYAITVQNTSGAQANITIKLEWGRNTFTE